MVYMINTK